MLVITDCKRVLKRVLDEVLSSSCSRTSLLGVLESKVIIRIDQKVEGRSDARSIPRDCCRGWRTELAAPSPR